MIGFVVNMWKNVRRMFGVAFGPSYESITMHELVSALVILLPTSMDGVFLSVEITAENRRAYLVLKEKGLVTISHTITEKYHSIVVHITEDGEDLLEEMLVPFISAVTKD